MKRLIIAALPALTLVPAHAVNVDFPGDGTSAGVLSSCLLDLSSAVDGGLGSQAPYTELSSIIGTGNNGQATVTAINLPLGTQVTFSAPTWVAMNGGYTSGSEQTYVRVTPLGGASCDQSGWSTGRVSCTLPSSLGLQLDENFQVDSRAVDSGGFPGTGNDYTLRTVVTCAG